MRKGTAAGLLILSVFLFGMAWKAYQPFAEAKQKKQTVIRTVISDSDDNSASELDSNPILGAEDPMKRRIDFAALAEINPDIIGWLYAPQIGVDDPILIGETDTEYLTKAFDGTDSVLGSIFTWADASKDLSDPHICLFGHNMISGQIFGQLHKYEEKEFRETYKYLYLYTPKDTKELAVEEVRHCKNDDAVFQKKWEEQADSQTVTLATCTGYGASPDRLVVICRTVRQVGTDEMPVNASGEKSNFFIDDGLWEVSIDTS